MRSFTTALEELNLTESSGTPDDIADNYTRLLKAMRRAAEGHHGKSRATDTDIHRYIRLADTDGWTEDDYGFAVSAFRAVMEPKSEIDIWRAQRTVDSRVSPASDEEREALRKAAHADIIDICRGIDTKQSRLMIERYDTGDRCPNVCKPSLMNPDEYIVRTRSDDATARLVVRCYVDTILHGDTD